MTTVSSATAPARARFRKILDGLRKPLKKNGEDPLGDKSAEAIAKSVLDDALLGDDIHAAALVHGAIEEFAGELAYVTSRFLKTKAWADTERIVVGGGLRQSRVGELAIARTDILLKAEGFKVDLVPIRFDPDEAGLVGCLHLAPSWIFEAHDSILAVDIGGTNIRCGLVENPLEEGAGPCRRRRSSGPSFGVMPTISRPAKAPSSVWSRC